MVRFHVRIMILYIVFILSVIFVIGFVGFSRNLHLFMGVRVNCEWWGWLWNCIEFWWILFGVDGLFNLFGRYDGSFWLYNGYGYRTVS